MEIKLNQPELRIEQPARYSYVTALHDENERVEVKVQQGVWQCQCCGKMVHYIRVNDCTIVGSGSSCIMRAGNKIHVCGSLMCNRAAEERLKEAAKEQEER